MAFMTSIFSPENLLQKVEALQGQNDALSEKSRHLNDLVQKHALERRELRRRSLLAAGGAAAVALLFAGLFAWSFSGRGTLSELNKALETTLARLENENREFSGRANSLQTALDAAKRENNSLKNDIQKNASAIEEKVFLEEILINKTKQIEALRGGSVGEEQGATLKSKDEEIVRLAEQNRVLAEKLERLYGAVRESLGAINVSSLTMSGLEQAIEAAKRRVEEEWNLVDLGSIKVDGAGGSGEAAEAPLKKQGSVRAVNEEHGFVVVDIGKADGIKKDTVLQVVKNGEWLATLQVLEVRDVMSACGVKNAVPGYKIRVNDSVTIRK